MKTHFNLKRHIASLGMASSLFLFASNPAEANHSLKFAQNLDPDVAASGDYNIDYVAYATNPIQFLAFSPKVALGTSPVLKFKVFVGDEWDHDTNIADQFSVWASLDGSSIGYNVLASSAPSLGGTEVAKWGGIPVYIEITVDLSAYAGKEVSLAFCFDPLDDVNNDYPGVRVDDIQVTDGATTTYSEDFESGEAVGWQLNGLWHVQIQDQAVDQPQAQPSPMSCFEMAEYSLKTESDPKTAYYLYHYYMACGWYNYYISQGDTASAVYAYYYHTGMANWAWYYYQGNQNMAAYGYYYNIALGTYYWYHYKGDEATAAYSYYSNFAAASYYWYIASGDQPAANRAYYYNMGLAVYYWYYYQGDLEKAAAYYQYYTQFWS